jgi:hypothetical protein
MIRIAAFCRRPIVDRAPSVRVTVNIAIGSTQSLDGCPPIASIVRLELGVHRRLCSSEFGSKGFHSPVHAYLGLQPNESPTSEEPGEKGA